ncbi:hypothetical protein ACWD4V_23940 [Streptomyces tsukubensis]|uniref:hypothetical protein n=1 Tax=Streptomyces tsukubensis TaxID=83656 RepID=UPI00367B673A
MQPDFALLRELVATVPGIAAEPGRGKTEDAIRAAESVVGPLCPAYRWWLAEYGEGSLHRAGVGTVAPLHWIGAIDVLDGWEGGDRLWFHRAGDGGDTYGFELGSGDGPELPVVRRDHFTGEEERFADSFAGFLTVWTALACGLQDGPNPSVARLWRRTPGAVLPDGTVVYGPALLKDRNEAHEMQRRAPHWVLVGDDGRGTGLFMRRHGRDRTTVYRLPADDAANDIGERGDFVTDDLYGWIEAARQPF